MFVRLDKYRAELERAIAKRAEWDIKVKELERKCKEEENTQIHGLVHAVNLTPEQLAELLSQVAKGVLPGMSPMTSKEVVNVETESKYNNDTYKEDLEEIEEDL